AGQQPGAPAGQQPAAQQPDTPATPPSTESDQTSTGTPVRTGARVTSVSVDAYCQWACATITADHNTTKQCMEHLMGWIADDLHVRRLRRIWQEMSDDLGERSTRMDIRARDA
ncbi:MAG: hypothetical protein ABWY49_10840, partial [Rhizobium sp.]